MKDTHRLHDTIMVVKLVEADYENGVFRPAERLSLRSGERVNLIVLRRPDPARWNLERIAETDSSDDLPLAQEGLDDWASTLDAEDKR